MRGKNARASEAHVGCSMRLASERRRGWAEWARMRGQPAWAILRSLIHPSRDGSGNGGWAHKRMRRMRMREDGNCRRAGTSEHEEEEEEEEGDEEEEE
eukprot:8856656-Pyramimonas_sp.AAC.1